MEEQTEMLPDTRLSHSSASILLGCEKRYFHYKVAKDDKDSDYNDSQDHFVIGSSFHQVLERTLYRPAKDAGMKIADLFEECAKDHGLKSDDVPLVHAMVLSFLRVFKEKGLEVVDVEFSIDSKEVIGFIDSLVKDKDGNWWIMDLKTARSVQMGLTAKLPMNRQLNLYASFADQFAAKYDLDIDKFKGCIYSVTTKSLAKQKKTEEYNDYVMRMAGLVRTIIFEVEKEKMNPELIRDMHMDLHKRSLELRAGEAPRMNLEYCFNYFSPCPYWSRCHNCTYTEGNGGS